MLNAMVHIKELGWCLAFGTQYIFVVLHICGASLSPHFHSLYVLHYCNLSTRRVGRGLEG